MKITTREFRVPRFNSLHELHHELQQSPHTGNGSLVRFAVTSTNDTHFQCEATEIDGHCRSIFDFNLRHRENCQTFNAVLLIPTGIGATIGGHAGDATPVAQLLADVCDTLVLHPNVVNASDINEMPGNSLYVEGSVICRLLLGTIGLQRVRSNRLLVLIGPHDDQQFVSAAINSVGAARATYGLRCDHIVRLPPDFRLQTAYTSSGAASGSIKGFEHLHAILRQHREEYDAVAITSTIEVPHEYHTDYFDGEMVNPWGGVEAMLTHVVSALAGAQSAHAPMLDSREIAEIDVGVVDPRMAAEAVSFAFFQCVLKGLQRSPRIVEIVDQRVPPDLFTANNVSCLVIPDGCLGLPTLAAMEQGIPVIAVRENRNVMRNDLSSLPWRKDQLRIVENYWEAAGVMSAMRAGIDPASVRRPLPPIRITDDG